MYDASLKPTYLPSGPTTAPSILNCLQKTGKVLQSIPQQINTPTYRSAVSPVSPVPVCPVVTATRSLVFCFVTEYFSVPIGTTTFPNQLPEALLSANVGALGVLLGEPSHVVAKS